MKRRTLLSLLLTGIAACATDSAVAPVAPLQRPAASRAAAQATLPSVLVIVFDDARCDMMDRATMPKLHGWVADSGLVFACGRGTANTSLCCPSRAGMFAGLDQHRTHVWDNSWNTGARNFNANATVFTAVPPTVVTALFGKYLNNSSKLTPSPYVVPGVDEERMSHHVGYYSYTLVEKSWQGAGVTEVPYGTGIQNYRPYVLARHFKNFVASVSAPNPERSFVAFLTPPSPHGPMIAAPQDVGACSSKSLYRPVNYNAPRTGQPQMLVGAPVLTPGSIVETDLVYRKSCETLTSADRMVDSVMLALQAAGRLDDTYVIVTSDNGFHFGDLFFRRKATPYEGATNVAFVVRGPGVSPRRDAQHFAQIIDITPTILNLVGGTLPNLAGRSLVPCSVGLSSVALAMC